MIRAALLSLMLWPMAGLAQTDAAIVIYKMGENGAITYSADTEIRTGIYPAEAIKPMILTVGLEVLVDGVFYLHRILGDELRESRRDVDVDGQSIEVSVVDAEDGREAGQAHSAKADPQEPKLGLAAPHHSESRFSPSNGLRNLVLYRSTRCSMTPTVNDRVKSGQHHQCQQCR